MFRRRVLAISLASVVGWLGLPTTHAGADSIRVDEWHLDYLRVVEAQALSQGSGVVVGVVDTGVSPHQDLRRNIVAGSDVITASGGDGQEDSEGHGTQMASLIAAHGRGTGV